MPVSREELEHLCRLAHIELREDELDELGEQISRVIDHVAAVQAVPTDGVPPTAFAVPLDTVLREDEVRPSWPVGAVLANAPEREGHLFDVQALFE
jgi:aspartyl-tRNA(Asn)/glutamyl-tRNA(Gln) amidotransferase subunit C